MILEILTYTHNITTMLFGIFLSAFFLGVKKDRTNVGKLLLLAVIPGAYIWSAYLCWVRRWWIRYTH